MKKIITIVLAVLLVISLVSCTQADKVGANISKEADLFNVTRRLVVTNARTDTQLLEVIGNFSLKNNSTRELEIICEVEEGIYKKHFVYLNEWTLYVVEDISGAEVSKYRHEVNYMPKSIIPFTVTQDD